MNKIQKSYVQADEWHQLKAFTAARIALGSTGISLPMKAVLDLRLAHAQAKDAVYSSLNATSLQQALEEMGAEVHSVKSKVANRDEYLQRPDLGRLLHDDFSQYLNQLSTPAADISIIIADGLSATAVNSYAPLFINDFLKSAIHKGYTISPIVLAAMARVAIGDEIGHLLNARLTLLLIGERPGLSASDSMGAYITYGPLPGNTDEKRNCVSNIRNRGLPPAIAAEKIMYLIENALRLQLTGVQLKDEGM
jgi:ethanolamine ammonia-lyase small subunit